MSTPPLNASSRIMYEESQKLGVTCTVFGDNETILMEKNGKEWYVRGSRTTLQSSVGKTIADFKPLAKKILEHFQIPTAKYVRVDTPDQLASLSQLQFPLVMKPFDERHGTGVVVGLQDIPAAQQAFENLHQSALFEEMLHGIEYRVVCVDFHFVAAAFRKPAHVVGDGEHTIQQLIDVKNQHPWRGEGHANNLSLIKVDDAVLHVLAEKKYTLQTIPIKDEEVILRKTANLSTGGEAWDVTSEVCNENKVLFEKISKVCDLNTIGIDVMCESLRTPIVNQSHAGVIEVNASPGLRMHHYPIQGQPVNIAQKIFEMVFRTYGIT